MKIPEKAIVDHLKEHISDVRVDTETQFEFSGIRQLTGRAVTLRQDVLYICGSAERMAGRETECASVCKLIRQADYEKCGGIENSIVIKNDSDLSEVADDILCLFEKASEFNRNKPRPRSADIFHCRYRYKRRAAGLYPLPPPGTVPGKVSPLTYL